MVPIHYAAHASLQRRTKPTDPSSAQELTSKAGPLESLIRAVMQKRAPDRLLYTIMVGEKVHYTADIEEIYNRSDFPRKG